jgi:hypothetical protein
LNVEWGAKVIEETDVAVAAVVAVAVAVAVTGS